LSRELGRGARSSTRVTFRVIISCSCPRACPVN
jgi:hypothetical protein